MRAAVDILPGLFVNPSEIKKIVFMQFQMGMKSLHLIGEIAFLFSSFSSCFCEIIEINECFTIKKDFPCTKTLMGQPVRE